MIDVAILEVLQSIPEAASAQYVRSMAEPENPESVRVAALTAYRELASTSPELRAAVKAAAQRFLSDRNKPVRDLAREMLRGL